MESQAQDMTVVACCQLAPELGNLAANRELAADAVSGAAAARGLMSQRPVSARVRALKPVAAATDLSAVRGDCRTWQMLG
jgi:hypothetical protein